MRRTPVMGRVPKILIRSTRPVPTPVVDGFKVPPLEELIKQPLTPEQISSAVKLAEAAPHHDPGWAQTYDQLLKTSCLFFATEKIRGPAEAPYNGKFLVGRHHLEWDQMIPRYDRMNILAARDHGKSFFWTLAYPIWKSGYNKPGSLGYIFSSTQPEAEKFLKMIKDELLENPEFAHLIPYTRDRFWSAKEIKLRNGSVIRARGFGVKVRGGHPDWVICDDVLDDEDIYSETIRRRNVDYFLSAIANMVPMQEDVPLHRRSQLVVVGTPMHQADLYAALRETGEYECRKYPCRAKDGTLLFPERYSEAALQRKRRELKSEARFAREFMCEPLSDEASLFPSHLFKGKTKGGDSVRVPYRLGLPASYWEKLGYLRYTGVDIAMSAETGGDYMVIFTVAVDPMGNRWIANIRREKGLPFQDQLDLIKDEYYLLRPEVILIEANQMQRVWADEIIRETDLPVKKFFTTGVGGAQPGQPWKKGATSIAVNKNHIDRGVPAMRISLENGKWRIPRGDEVAIEQTDYWIGEMGAIGWIDGKVQSVGEHDDTVMACWMCNTAVTMGANARLDMIESGPKEKKALLSAPTAEELAPSVAAAAEMAPQEVAARKAMADINEGRQVDVTREVYLLGVRDELHRYAGQCVDWGDQARAIATLEQIKRLDRIHKVRAGDVHLAPRVGERYGDDTKWKPREHAPTTEDLGVT